MGVHMLEAKVFEFDFLNFYSWNTMRYIFLKLKWFVLNK